MSDHVCAEIAYDETFGGVHSDICGSPNDPEWRAFLHANLDEWLNKSNGTGIFYVGNNAADYFKD